MTMTTQQRNRRTGPRVHSEDRKRRAQEVLEGIRARGVPIIWGEGRRELEVFVEPTDYRGEADRSALRALIREAQRHARDGVYVEIEQAERSATARASEEREREARQTARRRMAALARSGPEEQRVRAILLDPDFVRAAQDPAPEPADPTPGPNQTRRQWTRWPRRAAPSPENAPEERL